MVIDINAYIQGSEKVFLKEHNTKSNDKKFFLWQMTKETKRQIE